MIKQIDLKGHHSFILFNCVYMWQTLQHFLASNCVKRLYYYLSDIVFKFLLEHYQVPLKVQFEVLININ